MLPSETGNRRLLFLKVESEFTGESAVSWGGHATFLAKEESCSLSGLFNDFDTRALTRGFENLVRAESDCFP